MFRTPQRTVGIAFLLLAAECTTSPSAEPPAGNDASGGRSTAGTGGTTADGGRSSGSGGRTPATGGAASGEGAGAGGSGLGGVAGADPALGGAPTDEPALTPKPELVTSGVGAGYFNPGALKVVDEAPDVSVLVDQPQQQMRGFGGAFSEKGWVALLALSEAERRRALRLLYSPDDGANFTWGRIPMGANQFARDRFTYDDVSSGSDYEMAHFSIERDLDPKGGVIPFIRAAQEVRDDIRFWANPWTPPPWMKDNGQYDGGAMTDTPETLAAYAQYFVKFVQAYEAEGIPIHSVQPQNEPDWLADYPSCAWGPADANGGVTRSGEVFFGRFVAQHLAPAFRAAKLKAEIWYGTFSQEWHVEAYWRDLLEADGLGLISGIGLQWSAGPIIPMVRQARGELTVMMSEQQPGNYPWRSPAPSLEAADQNSFWQERAPNNHGYALETWGLLKQWLVTHGVNAYSAWNMVTDEEGFSLATEVPWPQNSLLFVDGDSKALTVTPAYYVLRHVSQFVAEGAFRIETVGGDAMAFKNPDGGVVAIVHNPGEADQVTNISIAEKTYQVTVPASGWATLNVE